MHPNTEPFYQSVPQAPHNLDYMADISVLSWYHNADDKSYALAELRRRGIESWIELDEV